MSGRSVAVVPTMPELKCQCEPGVVCWHPVSKFSICLFYKAKVTARTHDMLFKTLSILHELMQSTVHSVLSSSSSDGSGGSSAA